MLKLIVSFLLFLLRIYSAWNALLQKQSFPDTIKNSATAIR